MAGKRDWLVIRQDDNGQVFVVAELDSEQEAQQLASTYEARGHKQLYAVMTRSQLAMARGHGAHSAPKRRH